MQPTISGIMESVKDGELALPEFQRDYKWPGAFIEELLRSVARGWPIGTLLLLSQEKKGSGTLSLEPRAVEDAPKCKTRPENLILDGQQRVTALFHALHGLGDHIFYVDLELLAAEGGFTDECLGAVRASRAAKQLGSANERRKKKIATLNEIYSGPMFMEWVAMFPPKERKRLATLRDDHLALFREHTVNLEVVSNSLPIEAIAKIFERTNRGVLRLDAFDLMVAIMYPHGFKLREKWEEGLTSNAILRDFAVEPIEILKLIALRAHLQQKGGRRKMTVKGVRQSDVLALSPTDVKQEWPKAIKAYVRALDLVSQRLGVIRPRVLPSETMLLPLADTLYAKDVKAGTVGGDKIARWFWGAIFTRQYARGANTKAVAEAETLRGWIPKREGTTPRYVDDFEIDEGDLLVVEEGNEILVRGIACLLITQGARSWAKRKQGSGLPPRLADVDAELAIHHVFPKKFLNKQTRARLRKLPPMDAPANQTLITAALNGRLLNQAPEYAIKDTDVDTRGIASHLIDHKKMKGTNYAAFARDRARNLKPLIQAAVAGHPPPPSA